MHHALDHGVETLRWFLDKWASGLPMCTDIEKPADTLHTIFRGGGYGFDFLAQQWSEASQKATDGRMSLAELYELQNGKQIMPEDQTLVPEWATKDNTIEDIANASKALEASADLHIIAFYVKTAVFGVLYASARLGQISIEEFRGKLRGSGDIEETYSELTHIVFISLAVLANRCPEPLEHRWEDLREVSANVDILRADFERLKEGA